MNDKPVELDRQVLVKYPYSMEQAIDKTLVEHRKQTGENITRPEWIRMTLHKELYSKTNMNTKERLQQLERKLHLGELPNVIERHCINAIKEGKNGCRIRFYEKEFHNSLGELFQKKLNQYLQPDPFKKEIQFLSYNEFIQLIIIELKEEMGVEILHITRENDPELYRFANMAFDVSWK